MERNFEPGPGGEPRVSARPGRSARRSCTSAPGVTPQLALGIFITAIGILLTLDRVGILDAGLAFRLWPAALIALGAALWIRRPDASARFWGGVWIFLGTWLLLNTLGIVRVGFWELFWPIVLLLIGLKVTMHSLRSRRPQEELPAGAATNLFAMLGESKRSSDEKPFRGGQMTSIMGGCQLDLREAVIPPGEQAVIEVFALMGGLEIWLPRGWAVTSDVVTILGGVEDKRLPATSDLAAELQGQARGRLVLRGHVVLSGLTIKN